MPRIEAGWRHHPGRVHKVFECLEGVAKVGREGAPPVSLPILSMERPWFDRIVSKIVKGLVYWHTKFRLGPDHRIEWFPIHAPLNDELIPPLVARSLLMSGSIVGDGVVEYGRFIWPGSPISVWLIVFFRGLAFLANVMGPWPDGVPSRITIEDVRSNLGPRK